VEILVELDRAAAIRRAIAMAGPGDAVLVAGKGHERVQLTRDGAMPHCDLDLVRAFSVAPRGQRTSRNVT